MTRDYPNWTFGDVHREACRRLQEERWEDEVIEEMNRLVALRDAQHDFDSRCSASKGFTVTAPSVKDPADLHTCGTCYRSGKPEEWQSCMNPDCPFTY